MKDSHSKNTAQNKNKTLVLATISRFVTTISSMTSSWFYRKLVSRVCNDGDVLINVEKTFSKISKC